MGSEPRPEDEQPEPLRPARDGDEDARQGGDTR